MSETLKGVFDHIMKERGLTQKTVVAAMGMGIGTFSNWRKDPESASDNTLKKIRNFTENPDAVLKGGSVRKKRSSAKQSEATEVSTEDLLAFASTPRKDLAYVAEVLEILGLTVVTVPQAFQLIQLHKDGSLKK